MHFFQNHSQVVVATTLLVILFLLNPVLRYVVVPLRIRKKQWRPVNRDYDAVEFNDIAVDLKQKFVEVTPQLSALGFSLIGTVKKADTSQDQHSCASLWVNRASGDTCQIIAIRGAALPNGMRKIVTVVTFRQEYEDDTQITTSNTPSPRVFPTNPKVDSVICSGVWDVALLYKFHCARCNAHRNGRTPRLPSSTAVAYLNEEWTKTFQRLHGLGYYRLDTNQQRYYPTLQGAYMMTWRLLWPLKQRQLKERDRIADEQLRSFGFGSLAELRARGRAKSPPPLPAVIQ